MDEDSTWPSPTPPRTTVDDDATRPRRDQRRHQRRRVLPARLGRPSGRRDPGLRAEAHRLGAHRQGTRAVRLRCPGRRRAIRVRFDRGTDVTGLDVIARLAETDLPRSGTSIRSTSGWPRRHARRRSSGCPPARAPASAERYAALRPSQRVRYMTYRVPRAERLTAIAARYHLPVADMRSANPRVKTSRPAGARCWSSRPWRLRRRSPCAPRARSGRSHRIRVRGRSTGCRRGRDPERDRAALPGLGADAEPGQLDCEPE